MACTVDNKATMSELVSQRQLVTTKVIVRGNDMPNVKIEPAIFNSRSAVTY